MNHSSHKNSYLKGVSIKLKRLRWNELMKKTFWKKCDISHPCISRICRQLVNVDLKMKMKNENAKRTLSAVDDNKSSCALSEQNIGNQKASPSFGEPNEPPQKKFKRDNVTGPSFSDELEDEHFTGFETPVPPVSANLEAEQFAGSETPVPPVSANLEAGHFAGFETPIPPVSANLEAGHFAGFETPIPPVSANLEAEHFVGFETPVPPLSANRRDLLSQILTASKSRNSFRCLTKKAGVNATTTWVRSFPKSRSRYSSSSSSLTSESDSDASEIHSTPTAEDVGETSDEDDEHTQNGNRGCIPTLITISSDDDDDDSDDSEIEAHFPIYTKSKFGSLFQQQLTRVSDSNPYKIPSSDETTDSRCSSRISTLSDVVLLGDSGSSSSSLSGQNEVIEVSEEEDDDDEDEGNESENNLDSSFDPTKFLSCDMYAGTEDQEEIPFMKSQNYQLNCDVRIPLIPLSEKDISNLFCLDHNINGVCGYKIRRTLQMTKFEAKRNKPFYKYSPPPVSQSQNDIRKPLPPLLDPFAHSVFAPIIRRDRLYGGNQKINGVSGQSTYVRVMNYPGGHLHGQGYTVVRPMLASFLQNQAPSNSYVKLPSSIYNPRFGIGESVVSSSTSKTDDNAKVSFIPSDAIGFRSQPLANSSKHPNFSGSFDNSNVVLSQAGGNYSYVVLPKSMTPTYVQIRSGQVVYQASPNQSSSIQTPPAYLCQGQRVNPSGLSRLSGTPNATFLVANTNNVQTPIHSSQVNYAAPPLYVPNRINGAPVHVVPTSFNHATHKVRITNRHVSVPTSNMATSSFLTDPSGIRISHSVPSHNSTLSSISRNLSHKQSPQPPVYIL